MRISLKLPLVMLASLLAMLVVAVTPAMAEFGLQKFAISARNENGTPDVQAGSHPYGVTNTFVLKTPSEGDPRDLKLELPPGFVGDPNATPKCTYQQFILQADHKGQCSNEAAVGVSTSYLLRKNSFGTTNGRAC